MKANEDNPETSAAASQLIYLVAALFDGEFSIDWLQEISQERASIILQALQKGQGEGWIAQTAPGFFRFADNLKQRYFLDAVPEAEKKNLYQRAADFLLRKSPDGLENSRTVARLLLHLTNDMDGCRHLLEEGNYYRKLHSYEKALKYYEKAIEDLWSLDGETANSLLMETVIHYSKVATATLDASRVISTIQHAIERAAAYDLQSYWALLKMNLAKHEWMRSNFKSAIKHFDEGRIVIEKIDDPNLKRPVAIFNTFFNFWKGRFRDTIESYERYGPAIENDPRGGFPKLTRLVIGTCYGHCGQISQGLGMLDSLRRHCLKSGNIGIAGHVSTAIGLIFDDIEQSEEAFKHYENALMETIQGHNNFGRLAALSGMARMAHKLNDNKKALPLLHEFLELSGHAQIDFRYLPGIMEICWSMKQGKLPLVEGLSLEDEIENALKGENIFMRGMGYYYQALLQRYEGRPSLDAVHSFKQAVKWLDISGHQIHLAKARLALAREYMENGQDERARDIAAYSAKLLFSFNKAMIPDDLRYLADDLRDRKHLLGEILKLGHELVAIRDYREVAARIISTVNRVIGGERGAIFLRNDQSGQLVLKAAKNLTMKNLAAADFAVSMNIIEETFRSGQGRIMDFKSVETEVPAHRALQSCICVPMTLRDEVIGVLYHDNSLFQSTFEENDLDILEYFAAQAAIAMDNARAYETLQDMYQRQKEEKQYFEEQFMESLNFEDIVGKSAAIRQVFARIDSVAATDATVLITGETGVGKELVARAIHRNSLRDKGPFIRVNCSAFSEQLISSELFGHEKGAFTGATHRRIGRFELANGGTIFLDEIGDIPLEVQVRLLQVLQNKEFERVGGQETLYSDFRLMAATNRNMEEEVEAGRFRKDLFYRLNVFPIHVPPLRERKEDVPLLAYHFLVDYAKKFNRKIERIPHVEMQKLLTYDWPGNIRELQNVIERGVILCQGPFYQVPDSGLSFSVLSTAEKDMSLEENERAHILRALDMTGGKVRGRAGAAEILNINPSTLYSRMKKLGISNSKQMLKESFL